MASPTLSRQPQVARGWKNHEPSNPRRLRLQLKVWATNWKSKKPGMELMQLFWNSCNAMALQDQVPTICLKNLVEVLIVLVTPVSQIDMQCALIIVMAKVTVSFRSLTSWSLRAFPVAWLHNQAGCWPGSSPAGILPEKKTTLYIPQNSWEKTFPQSYPMHVTLYWLCVMSLVVPC